MQTGTVMASQVMRLLLVLTMMCVSCRAVWAKDTEDQPSASAVRKSDDTRQQLADEKELIRLFADTLEQVKSKYVESDVTDRELIEAAIRGMISKLDPYSNYIPPQDLDQFRKGVEREFVGIGIQVSDPDRDGHLQIVSPLFGTPAWRAGLRAGDRILKIDDTSTRGLSLDDAIKLMGGKVGSEVTVTVLHPDGKQAETVQLTRERIQQPTVLGFQRNGEGVWDFLCDKDHKIGYVRIAAFSRNTSRDLEQVLKQSLQEGMQGLVMDLRFNPGGMLSEAIKVSDLFLHEGRIVSIQGRSTPEQIWDARQEGTLIPKGFPVAVLVNRFSASAAEIVSACLQDNKVATIVGERTWGKGSVQNIIELEHGKSALKLTTAGYHRPSGKNIHREIGASETDVWGVLPDDGFAVRYSNRDLDNLGILFDQRDQLTGVDQQPSAPDEQGDLPSESEAPFMDLQLEKAVEAVRSRLVPAPESATPETATPESTTPESATPTQGTPQSEATQPSKID